MSIAHFARLKMLIDEAIDHGIAVNTRGLTGLSGIKLLGMLQRLARYQESQGGGCYLEIGVFQGLSLISTASALKSTTAFGIDNFQQFDPEHKNQTIIEQRIRDNNLTNVRLINQDFEVAMENPEPFLGDQRIATYFVDGPHDYRSQLLCLQLARSWLSSAAVIVVDDSNYPQCDLQTGTFW